MALTTAVKSYINRGLQKVNLRLDTLTAERAERNRLKALEERGYFAQSVFSIPQAFERMAVAAIFKELSIYKSRFDDFTDASRNDVGYTFANDYFSSPDAEVLYTMVRKFQPRLIVEVGSGNSTKIARQAILDAHIDTRLVSIDPNPRTEIGELADEIYHEPVEIMRNPEIFRSLKEGDIFFIDSSHIIKTGNDVVSLYMRVLPELSPGVLIHIHDIFLPYEYPKDWIFEKGWDGNEQYLVQSILTFSDIFEVLWAGHFLQRTKKDFSEHFLNLNGRLATSLWLRKTK